MKIHIEIDCTPEEARRFFGLPDVEPVQRRVMEALEKRLGEAVERADPAALLQQWLPLGLRGLEQWQSFWARFAEAATAAGGTGPAGTGTGPRSHGT